MGWDWLAPLASTLFTVLETTVPLATGIACAPCVPFVAGGFAVGGIALNEGLGLIDNGGSGTEAGLSQEQFDYLQSSLDNVTDIVLENQEMLVEIKGMLQATAAENREMMRGIQTTLKKFETNMNQQFLDLKKFVVEKDFIDTFQGPIKLLWKRMETASTFQTKETIQEFIDLYNEKSARRFLEEFVNRLDSPHTNPIYLSMDSHVLESREVLKDYLHLLSNIVVKVLAIEGFYHGVSVSKSDSKVFMESLKRHIDTAIRNIKNCVADLNISKDKFWPDLVNETVNANNDDMDTIKVADKIKAKLDGIYTKDVLTIYVFECNPVDTCFTRPLLYDPPLIEVEEENNVMQKPQSNAPSKFGSLEAIGAVLTFLDGGVTTESPKIEEKIVDDMATLVGGYNHNTKLRVVILHSDFNDKDHSKDETTVKTGYKSFVALTRQQDPCATNGLFDVLKDLEVSNLVDGFLVCNAFGPVISRFTNNGKAIIPREDMVKNKFTPFYSGLAWV